MELASFKINDAFGLFSILASNGVVLAAEKKQKSILFDDSTINKVELVTKSIGMVYSGMGPDYRFLFFLSSCCLRDGKQSEKKNIICMVLTMHARVAAMTFHFIIL